MTRRDATWTRSRWLRDARATTSLLARSTLNCRQHSSPNHQQQHSRRLIKPSLLRNAMSTAPEASASIATSPPAKRIKTVDDSITAAAAPAMAAAPPLLIKKLSDKARLPTRGSAFAAGYDIYAARETTVPARGKVLVDTDISIAVPAGTCKCFSSLAGRRRVADARARQTGASRLARASHPSTSSTRAQGSSTPTTAARSRCCCSTTRRATTRSRRATALRSSSSSASIPRRWSRSRSWRRACAVPAGSAALAGSALRLEERGAFRDLFCSRIDH